MVGPVWKRFAWKFAGVVPWGAGFLVFACESFLTRVDV